MRLNQKPRHHVDISLKTTVDLDDICLLVFHYKLMFYILFLYSTTIATSVTTWGMQDFLVLWTCELRNVLLME